jgi:hypothetical protein
MVNVKKAAPATNKTALIWEINQQIYTTAHLVYDNSQLTNINSKFVKPGDRKQVIRTEIETREEKTGD